MKKRHFRSDCEEKLWEGCGGTGHGVDVCPSVKQVAKQEAALAFENADLEQDEEAATLSIHGRLTTGKSERVGEVQRMSQQARNDAWISERGASTHMASSSTGMASYRKCEIRVRVADGRSLEIVAFGESSHVSVRRDYHSVEAMQRGTRTRGSLQPAFPYRPFGKGSRVHWRPRRSCSIVTAMEEVDAFREM